MIYIEEREPKKIPGSTSLFLKFNYNINIINFLKSLSCKSYDKKKFEWEIPICSLKTTIDNLYNIDDITLKLLKDKKEKKTYTKITSEFKITPYQYQLEGIEYGLNHKKWLLLDKMGLGKTIQAILLAEELHNTKNLEHCLIICGVGSLKSNWRNEINKFSKLDCIILGEKIQKNGKSTLKSIKERVDQLSKPIKEFFIITNIETLREDKILKVLKKGPNKINMIVVDEIHTCRNSQCKQGKNLLKLNSDYQLGMTGTPLMNNPLDVYVPLRWIDADKSTLTNFKSNYCIFDGQFHNILMGYKNLDMLKQQLEDNSLKRTNDVLNLPPKTIIPEYLDMNDDHADFYNNIKNGVVEEVDKVKLTTTSLLAMLTRLRQATASPSILTTSPISSTKIDRACDLIDQIIQNGDKVVVFSTFKETINDLKQRLKQYNIVVGTGDTKDEELNDNINKFQNDPDTKIFLGTWQKCGTGLTLTAASYMIFIDTPWTSAHFQQSCDRIYRIGTKKPVFIYVLMCKDTVDEKVFSIVNDKQALSDYVVDDILSDSNIKSLKKYIEDLK